MKMTRSRAAAAACALVMAALGGAALWQGARAERYRRQLENGCQEALGQLSASAAAVAVDLEKACYTGSPAALAEAAARLWRECGTAQAALALLPDTGGVLEKTGRFYAQAGDCAMALARQTGRGGAGEARRGQLAALLPYAQALAAQADALESEVLSGEIPADTLALSWLEEGGDGARESGEARPAAAGAQGPAEPAGTAGAAAFAAMEEGFAGYPRLLYDGPFSSHLENRAAALTQRGEAHLSRRQGAAAAAAAMAAPESGLAEAGDENGRLPAYHFTWGTMTAAVTKQGGHLLYLTDSRTPGGAVLTAGQALPAAQKMLEALGYRGMQSTCCRTEDGVCLFSFAFVQNGVVCYTDLVKVGVALDSGRVVQLDARGYLGSHRARTLPAPAVTADEAQARLSSALQPRKRRLALIPTAGGQELLCHEFLCTGAGGRQVLAYLNAATGDEEQLLLVQADENGTLTV